MAKLGALGAMIEADVLAYTKIRTEAFMDIVEEVAAEVAHTAIQQFYGSYSPIFDSRTGVLDTEGITYKKYRKRFSNWHVRGGIRHSIGIGGNYPTLDQPRYLGHRIYHGQSIKTVSTYNWEQGSHGGKAGHTIYTEPIHDIAQNMLNERADEILDRSASAAVGTYSILTFS